MSTEVPASDRQEIRASGDEASRRAWLGLEGRRVLLLGAGSFGQACARGYIEQGARLLVADRRKQALAALEESLDAAVDGACQLVPLDVRTSEDCRELVRLAAEQLGGLDVLVHAVGTNDRRTVRETSDDSWNHVLATNLTSAFWLAREAIDLLRSSPHGKMIFFSSVSGTLAHPKHGAYAASKGGLNQLVRVLAMELAADGIHVNGIAPGYVETNLTVDYLADPAVRQDLESRVPMGRLGAVQDVVGPALFLSSHRSDFMTGRVIVVDGGRSLD